MCQSHGNINLQHPSRLEAHPLETHLVQVSVVKRFMHPPPIAEEAMEKKDPPSPMDQPEESFFRQPIQESIALRATLSHPLETQISHEDDVGKRGSFVQAATYYELINQNYTRKYPFLSHPYFWYKYLSIYISYININLRLNSPWRPIVSAACFAAVGNRNLIRPLVWDNRWAARIKRYIC